MKVIFLDIDGVLVTQQSLRDSERSGVNTDFCPMAVACLNDLIQRSGAKVIVSSTWRMFFVDVDVLELVLRERGVVCDVIGVTPVLYGPRGLEIQAWLDVHSDDFNVESFIIVDDDADMVHLKDRLVHTSFKDGLTDNHVKVALKLLEH